MSITVTATQGGSTANGMLLRVVVLTGAAAANLQTGATASVLKAASNTFTTSITTTRTGSRVYGAIEIQASTTSVSAAAATTLIDDVNDATNSDHYTTFKATSLTGTPGATTLGATNTSPSAVAPIVMLEVLPSGTGSLAEDTSGPAGASTTSATTVTTAAFNPPAGSLLVALIASDGGAAQATMTVSGGGLAWTEKVKQNTAGNDYAGIWIAQVPGPTPPLRGPVRAAASRPSRGRVSFSAVTAAQTAPVPATGPVFHPAVQAVRARYLPHFPVSGAVNNVRAGNGALPGALTGAGPGSGLGSAGAPVSNPAPGPVFRQAVQAARARQPQLPFSRGRCYSSPRAPVNNPASGPGFRQKPAPVRFILPPWQPRAGRIGSSFGAPVQNPAHGPPVYAPLGPARARLPQLQPRAGRVTSSSGAPVRNPVAGPVSRQAAQPARARTPLPPRGRSSGNPGTLPPVPPAAPGPKFRPQGTVAARLPLSRRGTVRAIRFWPLPANPVTGPVFRQAGSPVQARFPLPPKGRAGSSPGGPVSNPAPVTTGPAFFPSRQPARARIQPPPRGRVTSSPGGPVRNPGTVTVSGAASGAARASLPVLLRGRTAVNPVPVRTAAPPVTSGPPFRQAGQPARIRPALPPRGRVSSNPGGPVRNPVPGTAGPVFCPRNAAAPRQPLPRRGACRAIRFYPLPANPAQGPPFRQATLALRARLPFPPPKGRTASSPAFPVVPVPNVVPVSGAMPGAVYAALPAVQRGRVTSNPGRAPQAAPPATGPVFRPAVQAVRARVPAPLLKGRVSGSPGTAPRNPSQGPAFRPAAQPARARQPFPAKGRTTGSPGGPVQNPPPPVLGPVFRQAVQAVRIRPALPPRGRIAGNPGVPARNPHQGAAFPAWHGPAQARFPLPPRGRVARNAGGPVRNPAAGPAFRQAVKPVRAVIPQNAPRGRVRSNPGGPVQNIPFARIVITTGDPFALWEAGTPFTLWKTDDPFATWAAGTPFTPWETGDPFTTRAAGSPFATP